MSEIPEIRFDTRQHRDGTYLIMNGCIDGRCTELGKVNLNIDDRPVAPVIRDWLNKMAEGDVDAYKRQTCDRLGGKTLSGGQCVTRPSRKSSRGRSRKS